MLLATLTVKNFLGNFTKEFLKTNQKEFRVEKVIKKKVNKLFVKWKDYDSFFNIWIDKKDII